MTPIGLLYIGVFLAILLLLSKPLGSYMARVFQGERTFLTPVLGPVERLLYRACGMDLAAEQGWKTYTAAMLLFNLVGLLLTYALSACRGSCLSTPRGCRTSPPDLAFNTAVSFTTNTNWQNYGGETTMCYFIQMVGLTMHNFISAATGMAIAIALVRGLARRSASTHRQLLGRSGAQRALRPAADLHRRRDRADRRWACPQNLGALRRRHHAWRARPRPSRRARWPARRSSRSWAPTAAASSTPTRRTRSRTRAR